MEKVSVHAQGDECMDLPPGFRFHPTDEEITTHYLTKKVMNHNFTSVVMGEVDLNKCEPWDLPSKAKMGEKEWYFFCHKDRKYPTGMRTNRATDAGYWKATGKDKEIYKGKGVLVGMKKTLVFYKGRAPKGEKTNWVMHEFRLEGNSSYYHNLPRAARDAWAVCKVFHKGGGIKKSPIHRLARMNSFGDDLLDSPTMPPLMDPQQMSPTSHENLEGAQGIRSGSASIPSDYYTMMGIEDTQDHHKIFMANNYSENNNQVNPSIYFPQNPYFSLPGSANLGYLHQDEAMGRALGTINGASTAIRKHCKAEQLSNNSMASVLHDAELITDRNMEISSAISKHNASSSWSYDDLDGSTEDFDNIWNC